MNERGAIDFDNGFDRQLKSMVEKVLKGVGAARLRHSPLKGRVAPPLVLRAQRRSKASVVDQRHWYVLSQDQSPRAAYELGRLRGFEDALPSARVSEELVPPRPPAAPL